MSAENEKPEIVVVSKHNCDTFNKQCNKYLKDGYFLVSISATPLKEAKDNNEAHFLAVFIKDKSKLAFNQKLASNQ